MESFVFLYPAFVIAMIVWAFRQARKPKFEGPFCHVCSKEGIEQRMEILHGNIAEDRYDNGSWPAKIADICKCPKCGKWFSFWYQLIKISDKSDEECHG